MCPATVLAHSLPSRHGNIQAVNHNTKPANDRRFPLPETHCQERKSPPPLAPHSTQKASKHASPTTVKCIQGNWLTYFPHVHAGNNFTAVKDSLPSTTLRHSSRQLHWNQPATWVYLRINQCPLRSALHDPYDSTLWRATSLRTKSPCQNQDDLLSDKYACIVSWPLAALPVSPPSPHLSITGEPAWALVN